MYAYPDPKCSFGYMTICTGCIKKDNIPHYVEKDKPIQNPPAVNKKQRCEMCDKMFILQNPEN